MTLVFLEVGGRGWSQGGLFAWVVFAFCFVSTAYTVVFIPYAALTPELARDFQERTNLTATGWRGRSSARCSARVRSRWWSAWRPAPERGRGTRSRARCSE